MLLLHNEKFGFKKKASQYDSTGASPMSVTHLTQFSLQIARLNSKNKRTNPFKKLEINAPIQSPI